MRLPRPIGASFPVMLVHLSDANEVTTIVNYDEYWNNFKPWYDKVQVLKETIAEEIDREVLGELIEKWKQ